MKKLLAVLCVLCLLATVFAGCGKTADGPAPADDGKLRIVTTFFPEYDWVNVILGDKAADAEVTLLQKTGVDLHSFQPKTDDIISLAEADVFIHVGGESDKWVPDALATAKNDGMTDISLMEALRERLKEEELKPGMQPEEEEEEEAEEEDALEYDEHVWLSLRNAAVLVRYIAEKLGACDPENAALYKENAESYCAELEALDTEFAAAAQAAPRKVVLFADRFPFRYFIDDYGLEYFAAFAGCSAETEASFQTVTFLAEKVKELDLACVLTLEGTEHGIADTIIETSGLSDVKILTLDSMQSVTEEKIAAGATYLDLMRQNIAVFTEALQ